MFCNSVKQQSVNQLIYQVFQYYSIVAFYYIVVYFDIRALTEFNIIVNFVDYNITIRK